MRDVTSIDGDVAIERHATIGGNAKVRGNVVVAHNIKVEGWLDAPNIRGVNKGVFNTYEALENAFPTPKIGWMALVGESVPMDVYLATEIDDTIQWVPTGGTSGEIVMDFGGLSAVEERVERLEDIQDETAAAVANAIATANEAKTTADGALTTAESAQSTANDAKDIAEAANGSAEDAVQTANNAVAEAENASRVASGADNVATNADTKAEGAIATANEAKGIADNSVEIANGAVGVANTANATANSALTTAGNAVAEAENASRVASGASNVATNADTKAEGAIATANEAKTTAEGAEQSVADLGVELANIDNKKADKDGEYDQMVVGTAKNILPTQGVENTASWHDRHTASTGSYTNGGRNVSDGLATLKSISGASARNLVANGRFDNGTDGWQTPIAEAEISADYVKFTSANRDGRFVVSVNQDSGVTLIGGHKYLVRARVKDSVLLERIGNQNHNANVGYIRIGSTLVQFPNQHYGHWCDVSALITAPADASQWQLGFFYANSTGTEESYIDRSLGIGLYDLTEMGIANLYTGTDAGERYAELFTQYVDGLQGASPRSVTSVGANAFDRRTMLIKGKGLDTRPAQLVKNYNFANGFAEFNNTATCTDMGNYIKVVSDGSWAPLLSQPIAFKSAHKYYLSTRSRAEYGSFWYRIAGVAGVVVSSTEWQVCSAIAHSYPYVPQYVGCFPRTDSVKEPYEAHFDKYYGIRLIDLTAMGCDFYLPNGKPTTVENCDAYFSIIHSYPYNDGSNYGHVIDNPTSDLLCVPVQKSVVGGNNGYRVDGQTNGIGWNPYRYNDSRFDRAYNVVGYPYSAHDYKFNGNGYLYIEAPAEYSADAVVHPLWSYTDQLNGEWYEDHKKFKQTKVTLPTHYIDGDEQREIPPLHGFDTCRDEIDLVDGRYIKRVEVVALDDSWASSSRDGVFVVEKALPHYVTTFGLLPFKQVSDSNIATYNGSCFATYPYYDGQHVVVKIDGVTSREEYEAYIATQNVAFLYALPTGIVYDLVPTDATNIYWADDFGTEHLEADGVSPEIVVKYHTPNYIDVIRNSASKQELAEAIQRVGTPSGDPMHYMYESIGAVWNPTTQYWEMNTLTDITAEDMRNIYTFGEMKIMERYCMGTTARTAYAPRPYPVTFSLSGAIGSMFANSLVEVVDFAPFGNSASNISLIFYNAQRVKRVYNLSATRLTSIAADTFCNCFELVTCEIANLGCDISFYSCRNLSAESVLYMIEHAKDVVLTITLHAQALARANADEDVQAALTAHGKITLAQG